MDVLEASRTQRGIRTFLKVCLEPTFQRIVVHEGPVVMGWERWREAEKHYTYGIIQEHAGKIRVDSQPGHGTRFQLEFPMRKAVNV